MKPKILASIAALVGPIQLTGAEIADKYDDSKTTVFQPDLIINSWTTSIVLIILIFTGAKAIAESKEAKKQLEDLQNK